MLSYGRQKKIITFLDQLQEIHKLKKKKEDKQTYLQSQYKTFISLTRTLRTQICKHKSMLRKLQNQDTCWEPRYLRVNFHSGTHSFCVFRQVRSLYTKYRLWNLTLWLKRMACHEAFKLWLYYIAISETLPSTREVRSVTFAAFLLPAGKFSPSLSNFSLKQRPPFFDFALS